MPKQISNPTSWTEYASWLKAKHSADPGDKSVRGRAISTVAFWAHQNGIHFPVLEPLAEKFLQVGLEGHRRVNGTLTKDGEAITAWAKVMLTPEPPKPVEPVVSAPVETPTTEIEEPMGTKERQDEVAEEELDEELDDEDGDDDEDEVPVEDVRRRPPPPPKRQAQRPVVLQVQAPRPPKQQLRQAVPKRERSSLIPKNRETIRLYTRDVNGTRLAIADYTTDDIGDMSLVDFIREFIHPEYGLDDQPTMYEATALDRFGQEIRGETARYTLPPLPPDPSQQQGPDAFSQVRNAFSLIQELQQRTQTPAAPKSEMLEEVKRSAAKSGDINSMMMLMMMERFMAPQQQGVDVLKVLDRLEVLEGKRPAQQAPAPIYHAPPPPEPKAVDKVVELAVANLVKPPASFTDQMRDLIALQQVLKPQEAPELATLRSELAALRAQISGGGSAAASPNPNSIESALSTVEKMTTVVKTLAPQLAPAAGLAGVVQGILSDPTVAKGLGKVIGSAMGNEQAGQPAQGTPASAAQPAAPVQTAPQQPPTPPAVNDALKAFQLAQTREVQVQRFVDLMLTMYLSKHPPYMAFMDPALAELNQADQGIEHLALPRKTILQILAQTKPELARPDFADAVIAAMAVKAGVTEMPKTLLDTVGGWTVDFRGEIIYTAKPQEPQKIPEQTPPAEPASTAAPAVQEVVPEKAPEKAPEPPQGVPPTPVQEPATAAAVA